MAYNSGSTALGAKVHAMYGRSLTPLNYRELVRKQTVSEVAAYLKQQTAYAPLLRDTNESLVHRGQLENILRHDLFDQYMKVFHYLTSGELPYYRFLITKMELDELLSCIRLLNAGRADEYILALPSFFAEHASIDLYALAKVTSFSELLNLLKSTYYYDILKKYDPSEGKKIDVIKIEIEFNRLYYSKVIQAINRTFSGEVKSMLKNSFGMQIDLRNITDVIRLKKYFNASSDYIRTLLLPYYYKVSRSELDAIMDAPDSQAAWKAACETRYGTAFLRYNFEFVENYAQQIMYQYHKRLFSSSTSAPVVVTAFLQLKEIEIQNIIHIIEGIRYELAPAEISKLLVGADN